MAKANLFFVDTNILVQHFRQKSSPTLLDLACAQYGIPVVSDFVVFELEVGGAMIDWRMSGSPDITEAFKADLPVDLLLFADDLQ